jgi:asparagine synthase (glutamine-hydrolysing)
MSGIAALLSCDGRPANPDDVAVMLQAIPYRGPDGMQIRAWPQVVLGHAKLAVTPEEQGEQQPLVRPETGCAVVADARLDNRDELLARFPDCPPTVSDAALILRAYEAWGTDAPKYLLGDFAFVIWDPNVRRLMCARDGAGQRSLFFRRDHRVFAVASEIHQLLQDPSVPLAPNDDRIREALVPFTIGRNEKDRPDTYYQGIRSVMAGQVVTVDDRGLRSWHYWRLIPGSEIHYRRREEYADQFRELLFRAVQARLRTAYPLGLTLSGGLDSSSIVCAVQELYRSGQALDSGFATLSVVYAGLECDERPYIEAIQQRYGFEAHYLTPDLSIETLAGDPAGFRERPNLATSGYDTTLRAATRLGMRAVLTGEISDACTRGVPMVFDSLLRAGQLGAFWRYLQAFRRLSQAPWPKIAALYLAGPLLPLPLHRAIAMAYVRRSYARLGHSMTPPWMPESLRTWLAERDRALSLAEERHRLVSSESRHWDMIALWPPEAMLQPAGWPLQLVRPYADRRLQEFLLAVPPQEKFEPHPVAPTGYAGSKQLIRRGLSGMLPELIRSRTQPTHFASAAADRWRQQWPAIEASFGPRGRSRLAEHGYVDQARFWERLQRLREVGWGIDLLHVDYCLGLEAWLRSFEQPRQQVVTVKSSWVATLNDTAHRRAAAPVVAVGIP